MEIPSSSPPYPEPIVSSDSGLDEQNVPAPVSNNDPPAENDEICTVEALMKIIDDITTEVKAFKRNIMSLESYLKDTHNLFDNRGVREPIPGILQQSNPPGRNDLGSSPPGVGHGSEGEANPGLPYYTRPGSGVRNPNSRDTQEPNDGLHRRQADGASTKYSTLSSMRRDGAPN